MKSAQEVPGGRVQFVMESMTLVKGLAELKLLDKRLKKKKGAFVPCAVERGQILQLKSRPSKTEFERNTSGAWQSMQALLDRRRKIRVALIKANSSAEVHIAGTLYTIAEALEMKRVIKFEQEVVTELRSQLAGATAMTDRLKNSNGNELGDILETVFAKKETQILDVDHQELSDRYREVHAVEIVDPVGIDTMLREMEAEIVPFLKEVDACIAEANKVHSLTITPS